MTPTEAVVFTVMMGTLSTIIAALITYIGVRHSTKKTLEQNRTNSSDAASAAEIVARAEVQRAWNEAYKTVDAHYARLNDGMHRWNLDLQKSVSENTRRIEEAELRAEAADVRATKAEHLYSIAIIYMRRVIRWINENLPGEDYPAPPPELNLDL